MKRLLLIGLLLICMAACGLADYEKLDLEVGEVTNGFRLKSVDELELVHAALYIFEHEATGAQLCYVSNDDTNRCFSIGFRTPVYTDTGIPHVFEHASLSGSEKYPDPNLIMSMMYGTYTTYLNAYTATTYTAYQASSLSEDQLIMDMDVILNGVFHPLLVKDERVMMREAYRYELEDRDSPLTLEGVVYSEMLGAQEHEQMATIQLDRLLYPGSCVGSVSGGLPEKIPEMTFEDLCQFHETFYTPSNSLTVLYGKMNIERYLKMLNETIFAGFERKEMHLEEESYRPAAGDIVAKYTYPASADTEPETVMYYAVPVDNLDASEEYALTLALSILTWPDHLMDRRMAEQFPDASWTVETSSTKKGFSILFYAKGIEESQSEAFKSICDEVLEDTYKNGFSPADVRVYADAARYTNALIGEGSDGLSIASGLIEYWDEWEDPRDILNTYEVMMNMTKLETEEICDNVFRKAYENAYGKVLLISTTDPGGREREEEAIRQKLDEMKAAMTEEEITALIDKTEDFYDWMVVSSNNSMLKQVTAVTPQNLPEEINRAEAKVEEDGGLRVISSVLEDTDYITNMLVLDASAVPIESLLPLRIFNLLSCRLETDERDRATMTQDSERVANNLWFSMTTQKDKQTDVWRPVYQIEWNTFKDLAASSIELIRDVVEDTSMQDISYIRSMLSEAAMDRRNTYKNGTPYSLAIQEATRQTDEETAYALLYGGYNLTAYEEKLVEMDDEALAAELAKAKDALRYVLHCDNATLLVAGDQEAIDLMHSLVKDFLSAYGPMGEPVDYREAIAGNTGNTAFMLDTAVSYNLEFLSLDQLGIEYSAALKAFTNLALDQALLPALRFENSVYSVFFQSNEENILLLSYRDPNLKKTFDEIFPTLGTRLKESLAKMTQADLDGYISSAYTSEAMPDGMIARAGKALAGALNNRDYFEETLENMHSLKALNKEKCMEFADILDRLYNEGLKMTVTGPQILPEAADLFEHVNEDWMK